MASCTLSISLDKTDRTYAAGEKITGVVAVRVDAECRCDRLTLVRQWRTHGRGNAAKGPAHETVLFQGTWQAGEAISYEFALDAPPGPMTYHGHNLNVDWTLKARADIPWALDPQAEVDIVLVSGPAAAGLDLGPKFATSEAEAAAARGGRGCAVFIGTVFALLGLGLIVGLAASEDGWTAIFGLPFLGVGLLIAYFGIRNTLAERALGPVQLRVDPTVRRAGTLAIDVGFRPTRALVLDSVTAKLVGREKVISGSGKNRTTHLYTFLEKKFVLVPGRALPAGERVSGRAELAIPPDAPSSFAAEDNAIEWRVQVHISLPGRPDWQEDVSVAVLP